MVMFFLILALVFVVLLVIITNIVIVPQSKVYVVERLGSYSDTCLLYTSPSPRDGLLSRMPSSA